MLNLMTKTELRAIRKRLGLTQQAFAEALGVHGSRTVRKWESGDIAIPETIAKLAVLLTPDNRR